MVVTNEKNNVENEYFENVYQQTINKAYYMAFSILKDQELAKDVLQESYIKVFTKIDTLQDESKLQQWVNTIVRNESLNYLKKRKEYTFSDYSDENGEDYDWNIEEDNIEFIPDKYTDYTETKKIMNQMLDLLPQDQRVCIFLYYYEQLSMGEISAILGCGEETVKSRLRYARKKLKGQVLELEKKGTKLYSIQVVPFLVWMFKTEAESVCGCEKIINIADVISKTGSHVSTANTVLETSKAVGGLATKKIVIGLVSATVVGSTIFGGAVVAGKISNESDIRAEATINNGKNVAGVISGKTKQDIDELISEMQNQESEDDIYDIIASEYYGAIINFSKDETGNETSYSINYKLMNINDNGYKELIVSSKDESEYGSRAEYVEVFSYDSGSLKRIYSDLYSYDIYMFADSDEKYLYFNMSGGTFFAADTIIGSDVKGELIVEGVKIVSQDKYYKIENIDYTRDDSDDQIYVDDNLITEDKFEYFSQKYWKVDKMEKLNLSSADGIDKQTIKELLMQDEVDSQVVEQKQEDIYAIQNIEILSSDEEYITITADKYVWVKLSEEEQTQLEAGQNIEKYGTTFKFQGYEDGLCWYTYSNQYTAGIDEEDCRCYIDPNEKESRKGYSDIIYGDGNLYYDVGDFFLAYVEQAEFKVAKNADAYMLDYDSDESLSFKLIQIEKYFEKYMNSYDEGDNHHFDAGFVKFDDAGLITYFKETIRV